MAEQPQKTPTQSEKDQARIKRLMKQDIDGVINTADILAGKKAYPTKMSKKVKGPSAQLDNSKNLPKFLKFMERTYNAGNLIKVNLKKDV